MLQSKFEINLKAEALALFMAFRENKVGKIRLVNLVYNFLFGIKLFTGHICKYLFLQSRRNSEVQLCQIASTTSAKVMLRT